MRKRRLTPFGKKVLLGISTAVILLTILLLPQNKPDPPNTSAPGGSINIDIEHNQYVDVYINGKIQKMNLDDYLVGVVAGEMPASYSLEALKAQAVAARTYTMYIASHGGCSSHPGADICTSSSCCQAYVTDERMTKNWGSKKEANLSKIRKAVSSTRGQMIYYDGKLIQAFYHACSGGWTEDCANVYREDLPYLKSVQSGGEEEYSNFYGEVTVSPSSFVDAMKKFSPSIKLDSENLKTSIGDIVRFESGRVESIRIGNETFTGREIRSIFKLNSADFTVKIGNKITFETVGFGHGVGMSQDGADVMAKEGADYIEILTHYYTGVTIK